jgi:hypothetical protein
MRIASFSSLPHKIPKIPIELLFAIGGLAVIVRAAIGPTDPLSTCLGLAFSLLASIWVACHAWSWSRTRWFWTTAFISFAFILFATFSTQMTAHSQLLTQTADAICGAFASAATGAGGATSGGAAAAKTVVKSIMWIIRHWFRLACTQKPCSV